MVVTKPGCRFVYVPATIKLLDTLVAMDVAPVPGQPAVLTITAGCNGLHKPESKHYLGEAIDLRSKNFPEAVKEIFAKEYERALGMGFTVRLERRGEEQEHFHVQCTKGTRYAGSLMNPIAEEYRA